MINYKKMTDRELAQKLGDAHGMEKAMRQILTDLKEEFKRRDLPELSCKQYQITRAVSLRSYFDVEAAKQKLGSVWAHKHTTMQEITAVHIKPRSET